jgi:2,3-bisphosphoglycerate-dependent phosphoglycerate mutase
MLNYFDPQIGYAFWCSSTMPDVYKVMLDEERLDRLERLWS